MDAVSAPGLEPAKGCGHPPARWPGHADGGVSVAS